MATAERGTQRPGWFARQGQEHARVFFFSLGKLWQNPAGALLTAAVIGITLALPASLHLLVKNLGALSYSWESSLQASLFLKDDVGPERGAALTKEIGARAGIASAAYISREQSLAEFRSLSGFGEALDLAGDNPLPAVIVVTPRPQQDKAEVDRLMQQLAQLPEVDLAKLDQQWLERLYAILGVVQRGVLLVALMLGFAVLVTVGNTIRLDIEARREEILVMKLVGAPDSFIRRPFLYTGFWYGAAGGLFALLLIYAGLLALTGPSRALAALYNSSFTLQGPSAATALLIVASGLLLGWLGAWWTVGRHLSKIEPA